MEKALRLVLTGYLKHFYNKQEIIKKGVGIFVGILKTDFRENFDFIRAVKKF